MNTDLTAKVAIVTGAARGIGFACAQALHAAGAHVLLTDLDSAAVQEAAHSLSGAGGTAIPAVLDVTDEARWQETIARAQVEFGGLDILVNNAGVPSQKLLVDTSLAEFRRVMAVNCDAAFLGMKYAIPVLARRGGGSIVNVASVLGKVAMATASAYCASKGALTLLTKAAALECAAQNIRVNSVHPGFIETPMLVEGMAALPNGAAVQQAITALHPLGRLGRSSEVAAVVAFLASDAASFVTGAEYFVDGGYTTV